MDVDAVIAAGGRACTAIGNSGLNAYRHSFWRDMVSRREMATHPTICPGGTWLTRREGAMPPFLLAGHANVAVPPLPPAEHVDGTWLAGLLESIWYWFACPDNMSGKRKRYAEFIIDVRTRLWMRHLYCHRVGWDHEKCMVYGGKEKISVVEARPSSHAFQIYYPS